MAYFSTLNDLYFAIHCYYYTIGNIHPMYRSTLEAIQLLCLVEAPLLEVYGHDKILEPAIKDIKQLEKVTLFYCVYQNTSIYFVGCI